jgi:hypothetical protein
MRKLFSSGLLFFAGVVFLPVPGIHTHPTPLTVESRNNCDPRLHCLRTFFERRDCPAARLSRVFLEASDANNLDWRLLPSISFVESTGGKSAPNNNLFGWDSGRAEFSSAVACIRSVAHSLANSVLYKDKDVDGILKTYNPDAGYARKVKSVMRRIAPSKQVEPSGAMGQRLVISGHRLLTQLASLPQR